MDIILVPGFWLDASSWSQVTPPLVAAGHRVHPLTLPGLEAADAPRAGIGLRDHIDAVVAAVDAIDGPVLLVGHSGGRRHHPRRRRRAPGSHGPRRVRGQPSAR